MKNKRYTNLRETGITLIALVVTIIVLLILAGVTISIALDNGGLIERAKYSKEAKIVGEEKEEIQLAYGSAKVGKLGDAISSQDLQDELDLMVGQNKIKVTPKDNGILNVYFVETRHNYTVQDGIISKTEDEEDPPEEGVSLAVNLPYTQTYATTDNSRDSDYFNYCIQPIDNAPTIIGSTGGRYLFSIKGIKGNKLGDLNITIPDMKSNNTYSYKVYSYETNPMKGFVYETREYTVKIYTVKNNESGKAEIGATTIMIGNEKYPRLEFDVAYQGAAVPSP